MYHLANKKHFFSFRLPDGSLMEITKVYPLDAVFDNYEDVPEDVSNRYLVSIF
jgi:enoyl-[acyl-carrier protein] reductase I